MCDTRERYQVPIKTHFTGFKVLKLGKSGLRAPFRNDRYKLGVTSVAAENPNYLHPCLLWEGVKFRIYHGIHVFRSLSAAVSFAQEGLVECGWKSAVVVQCTCRNIVGRGLSSGRNGKKFRSTTVEFCRPIRIVWRSRKRRRR